MILIASFLKEDALTWFEPIMRDFIENDKEDWDEDIKKFCEDYNEFEQALKEAFGNPDEEREAERRLQNLRQTKAASTYAAKFRQLTSKLDWDLEPYGTVLFGTEGRGEGRVG